LHGFVRQLVVNLVTLWQWNKFARDQLPVQAGRSGRGLLNPLQLLTGAAMRKDPDGEVVSSNLAVGKKCGLAGLPMGWFDLMLPLVAQREMRSK
jgi:hypothetical protein